MLRRFKKGLQSRSGVVICQGNRVKAGLFRKKGKITGRIGPVAGI
ncbi:MAG: hypothetical protein Kow00105_15350 [Phycisphaeraceae bacterium]